MVPVYFDGSLGVLVDTIAQYIDKSILTTSAFIRDIDGRLGVVLNCNLSKKQEKEMHVSLCKALGGYANSSALLIDRRAVAAEELLAEAMQCPTLTVGNVQIHIVDRRVVGVEWQTNPATYHRGSVRRYVFASIKGGVGRSTALCIAAAHLSRRGYRVLTIDFDLEAPGIGSMLLKEDELPRFGSLDFLVESQVSRKFFGQEILYDLIGHSSLGFGGAPVGVVPAIGQSTITSPQNALAKIARAYLEFSDDYGTSISLGGKLRALVELCESTKNYDFVLVDSRAGLHESTAAAMLALGGELLLFGNDQPQTFQGYRLLFSHLAQFAIDPENDWRERVTFVHAKAGRTEKAKVAAKDKFREIFSIVGDATKINQQVEESISGEDIDFVWDESRVDSVMETLECQLLHIVEDGQYHDFDPVQRGNLLEISSYESTFSELTNFFDNEIDAIQEGQ